MKLTNGTHTVNTSSPTEQVNLKSRGYKEVPVTSSEPVEPMPKADAVKAFVEAFEPYEIEDFDD